MILIVVSNTLQSLIVTHYRLCSIDSIDYAQFTQIKIKKKKKAKQTDPLVVNRLGEIRIFFPNRIYSTTGKQSVCRCTQPFTRLKNAFFSCIFFFGLSYAIYSVNFTHKKRYTEKFLSYIQLLLSIEITFFSVFYLSPLHRALELFNGKTFFFF